MYSSIRIANRVNINVIIPILILSDGVLRTFYIRQGRQTLVDLIYITVLLIFLKYKDFRKITLSAPLKIWIILTLYHLVNATLKHVPEIDYFDYLHGTKIYAAICIFTFLIEINAKKTFQMLYFCFGVWLFVALFFIRPSTIGERLSGEMFIAVEIGKIAALMAVCGIMLSCIKGERITIMLLRMLVPWSFIMASQTRNAMGMSVIFMVGYYYTCVMKSRIIFKHLFLMLLGVIAIWMGLDYMMEHTGIGERFQYDFDMAEEQKSEYMTGTWFDTIVGERIVYWVTGWEIFIQHPITGIGLDNYSNFMHGIYPMHVEYMTHLAEGGIIAAGLWILFLTLLMWGVSKSGETTQTKTIKVFVMLLVLFTCMYSVMYEQENTMLLYATILARNEYVTK